MDLPKFKYLGYIVALLFSLQSCEKVIEVDLNTTDPKIIIEGQITDQNTGCQVKLSESVNFSSSNFYPPISGAIVKISDGNTTVTLTETAPGIYTSNDMSGEIGKLYTLTLTYQGSTYTAQSIMPQPTDLQSLQIMESAFNRPGQDDTLYQFLPVFTDPINEKNFYRYLLENNGIIDNDFQYVINDNLINGRLNQIPLPQGADFEVSQGDTITLEMRCFDKGVYDYFYSLGQLYAQGGNATTPANPISNISNGALGYFAAYTVRKVSAIVP